MDYVAVHASAGPSTSHKKFVESRCSYYRYVHRGFKCQIWMTWKKALQQIFPSCIVFRTKWILEMVCIYKLKTSRPKSRTMEEYNTNI